MLISADGGRCPPSRVGLIRSGIVINSRGKRKGGRGVVVPNPGGVF